jgi:hypothetical protein
LYAENTNVRATKSLHVGCYLNKYLNVKLRSVSVDKLAIGSNLRSLIEYYTELTVDEHMNGTQNKEADKTWKKINQLINKLTGIEEVTDA